jgi:predicted NBD/HSP70 family sugar kinase
MFRCGIDLGGSKIEIIVLDQAGTPVLRRRSPTPQGDYPGTLLTISRLVEEAEAELGVSVSVGIGTPGAISKTTGKLKNSNSTCLNGQALREDLASILRRPVRIANDADCFALSEAVDGAAAGAAVVFGVILGTGVGAGIVVNGALLSGPNAIAGEWGHNPLPWPLDAERPGPLCYCGKQGCIETFLSGPGLAHAHELLAGQRLSAEAIEDRAAQGDPAAQASMALYEDRLARALAHVINILDPDIIVLGGGMSKCERLYQAIPKLWGRHVFSDSVETVLKPPRHGDSGGVRGAAWLWQQSPR